MLCVDMKVSGRINLENEMAELPVEPDIISQGHPLLWVGFRLQENQTDNADKASARLWKAPHKPIPVHGFSEGGDSEKRTASVIEPLPQFIRCKDKSENGL